MTTWLQAFRNKDFFVGLVRAHCWMFLFVVGFLSPSARCLGVELNSIEVQGEKDVTLAFQWQSNPQTGSIQISDESVDIVFPDANLASKWDGKIEIANPHFLVRRVSAFPAQQKGIRCRIFLNGSLEGLKDRVKWLGKDTATSKLRIELPKVSNAVLQLMKDEQRPIESTAASVKTQNGAASIPWGILAFVFLAAGVATVVFVRVVKKKAAWVGTRKYLVESLAYCPIGPNGKTGVGLVKVGTEFVLVGVGPQGVQYLSNLPKLQKEYEEETAIERDTFKSALREEVRNTSRLHIS